MASVIIIPGYELASFHVFSHSKAFPPVTWCCSSLALASLYFLGVDGQGGAPCVWISPCTLLQSAGTGLGLELLREVKDLS